MMADQKEDAERSKTETIKERTVYVSFPSIKMHERWKGLAKERGQSLSKFVMEQVEDSLSGEEEDFETRVELLEKKRKKREPEKELSS